ncbi:MAG: DUF3800 domain-containing protein [bacterium]|nr:DUF3800 domain-containing protein [bacterium]MDZ4347730.1 DUF3800 domain-containing protein [Candidatus Binatia bacterium]
MKLIFIDETGDAKDKDYLAFCVAVVDSKYYPLLKNETSKILKTISWKSDVEFKGTYLFSIKRGCADVDVEKRIDAAGKLLDLNVGKSNARIIFGYGHMKSSNRTEDYLSFVPSLITKVLPRAPRGGTAKNLAVVMHDELHGLNREKFNRAVTEAVMSKGYVLYEEVIEGRSSTSTVGLMFADLVAYLMSRVDVITKDAELFENLSAEQFKRNGKIRKLKSSTELLRKIKKLNVYKRK